MRRLALLFAIVVFGGCGSDGGGGGGGGSGGTGGGGQSNACVPSGATVVVPEFETDGVVRRLLVDSSHVYVGALHEIYAAPRSGGNVEVVFPPEGGSSPMYPAIWLRGDKLLVGAGDKLWLLPKTGGAIEETISLPHRFTTNLDGSSEAILDPDGRTFFGKRDPIVLDGQPVKITYFSHDLESGSSTTILEDTEIGHHELMVRRGPYLYTAHSIEREFTSTAPDELYRIPVAGGAPEKLSVEKEMRMELVGADDRYLYLYGLELPIDVVERPAALYRVPLEGGAQERLMVTDLDIRLTREFVEQDDHIVYRSLNGVYRIDKETGETVRITSSRCIWAIAVDDGELFLALRPKEKDVGIVARLSY